MKERTLNSHFLVCLHFTSVYDVLSCFGSTKCHLNVEHVNYCGCVILDVYTHAYYDCQIECDMYYKFLDIEKEKNIIGKSQHRIIKPIENVT